MSCTVTLDRLLRSGESERDTSGRDSIVASSRAIKRKKAALQQMGESERGMRSLIYMMGLLIFNFSLSLTTRHKSAARSTPRDQQSLLSRLQRGERERGVDEEDTIDFQVLK